ncbi:MAG: hypothetical protein JST40_11515 [Armatimonadetes bacterium]|nr:hypothetical protein [Armatimonadota bacterium]
MRYFVEGSDGNQYGPVEVETLKTWVAEGRVQAQSVLRHDFSGERLYARDVPGLFIVSPPVVSAPPVQQNMGQMGFGQNPSSLANNSSNPHDYSRPPDPVYYNPSSHRTQGEVNKPIYQAAFSSVLALILFFVLHGIGLIVAGTSVFRSLQYKQAGHEKANIALIISVSTLILVAVGWIFRISTTGN